MLKRLFVFASLALAVAACNAEPRYQVPDTIPMTSPKAAQDRIKGLLLTGKVTLIDRDGLNSGYEIHDVRFRKDGMAILTSNSYYGETFGPDVDKSKSGVATCYFTDVATNPTVFEYTPGLFAKPFTNWPYHVVLCAYQVGFYTFPEAQAFANALYVLKRNSQS